MTNSKIISNFLTDMEGYLFNNNNNTNSNNYGHTITSTILQSPMVQVENWYLYGFSRIWNYTHNSLDLVKWCLIRNCTGIKKQNLNFFNNWDLILAQHLIIYEFVFSYMLKCEWYKCTYLYLKYHVFKINIKIMYLSIVVETICWPLNFLCKKNIFYWVTSHLSFFKHIITFNDDQWYVWYLFVSIAVICTKGDNYIYPWNDSFNIVS